MPASRALPLLGALAPLLLGFARGAAAIPVSWSLEGTIALGDCSLEGAYCSPSSGVSEAFRALGIDVGTPFAATVSFESDPDLFELEGWGPAFAGADVRIAFAAGSVALVPVAGDGPVLLGIGDDRLQVYLGGEVQGPEGALEFRSALLAFTTPYDGAAAPALPTDPPGDLEFNLAGLVRIDVASEPGLDARFIVPTVVLSARRVPEPGPTLLAALALLGVAARRR